VIFCRLPLTFWSDNGCFSPIAVTRLRRLFRSSPDQGADKRKSFFLCGCQRPTVHFDEFFYWSSTTSTTIFQQHRYVMAEIRSTLDMVMERAARLAAEAPEVSTTETVREDGMRLAVSYLGGEDA
jgi:hypothetical protein